MCWQIAYASPSPRYDGMLANIERRCQILMHTCKLLRSILEHALPATNISGRTKSHKFHCGQERLSCFSILHQMHVLARQLIKVGALPVAGREVPSRILIWKGQAYAVISTVIVVCVVSVTMHTHILEFRQHSTRNLLDIWTLSIYKTPCGEE